MDSAQLLVFAAVALAVLAFVAWPLVARGRRGGAGGAGGTGAHAHAVDVERVEARIVEYREALRRRTVCGQCLYANPAAARYCAQCGTRLAPAG